MTDTRFNDAVRDWLADSFRKSGRKKSELADKLGVAPSAVTRILSGDRQLSADELPLAIEFFGDPAGVFRILFSKYAISDFFEAPNAVKNVVSSIFTGQDSFESRAPIEIPDDFVAEIDLNAQIGTDNKLYVEGFFGHIYLDNIIRSQWKLPLHVMEKLNASSGRKLRCIENPDDAMSPTIEKGDSIFVDITVKSVEDIGIYAIKGPLDRVIIRRCEPIETATDGATKVRILCDNERYPARIDPYESMRVAGRVVGRFSLPR